MLSGIPEGKGKVRKEADQINRGKNPSRGEGITREKFQKAGEEIGSFKN
jgi:hypothetical protein